MPVATITKPVKVIDIEPLSKPMSPPINVVARPIKIRKTQIYFIFVL